MGTQPLFIFLYLHCFDEMNDPVVRWRVVDDVVVGECVKGHVFGEEIVDARVIKVNGERFPGRFVVLGYALFNPRHYFPIKFAIKHIFNVLGGCFPRSVFNEIGV